jgi:hypothetical protein
LGRIDHHFIPAYLADHYTRDDRQVLAAGKFGAASN